MLTSTVVGSHIQISDQPARPDERSNLWRHRDEARTSSREILIENFLSGYFRSLSTFVDGSTGERAALVENGLLLPTSSTQLVSLESSARMKARFASPSTTNTLNLIAAGACLLEARHAGSHPARREGRESYALFNRCGACRRGIPPVLCIRLCALGCALWNRSSEWLA